MPIFCGCGVLATFSQTPMHPSALARGTLEIPEQFPLVQEEGRVASLADAQERVCTSRHPSTAIAPS